MIETLNWFALLTRSNFEQIVYTTIVKKQIDAFLPKLKQKSTRKDRNLMIEKPLFPGYVFVQSSVEPAYQLKILKTIGAVRLLGNKSGPLPIPRSQIESLKIMTSTSVDLITGANVRLKKGDPVTIIEGPLAGVKGEFTRHKGKGRVVIKIEALGQYAGVEVDENNIEKLPEFLA